MRRRSTDQLAMTELLRLMMHRKAVVRRPTYCPSIETLEIRITPTVQTWVGGVAGSLWSNAANWQSDVAPVGGDSLIFPSTATTYSAVNDLSAGTQFGSIEIDSSSYALTGNLIKLDSSIHATYATGLATFAINTQLNGSQTIEVDGGTLDFSGVIGLANGVGAGVTKSGAGTLQLDGTSSYTGSTTVTLGALTVDGNISASSGLAVNTAAELLGDGTVPNVVLTGAQLAMGSSPSILTTGSVALDGASTFSVDLTGTSAGTGYSQVIANGAVNLGGASLVVNVNYIPSPGDQLTILQNNSGSAITGTFAGLPEGDVFTTGSGVSFQISYQGGSNHQDVVLTAIATTTTTVTSTLASPTYGQSVTFTAVVAANFGTPTGTVTFDDNGVALSAGTVNLVNVAGQQQASYTTTALAAGNHPITVVYTPTANSDTTGSSGSLAGNPLVVTPAALTITAVNKTKAYAATLPALTATYSGFVNGDTSSNLTTQPTLTTTAVASSHVAGSPYSITAGGAADPNYTISYLAGTLTITKVALTITAVSQTKTYGAALPTLTASYVGLVNGDTSTNLTTQPTLTTTATAASQIAGNPYSITAGGAVDTDYTISYVAGTLTVTTATLVITAVNESKVYGTVLPVLAASYAGFVNSDTAASLSIQPALSTTAIDSSHVAGSPYSITASGAADPNYTISYVAGTLTVTPASLTITAVNMSKAYGAALPTLTASFLGLVNGDTSASLTAQPTLSTTALVSSHISGSPYTITAGGAADADYSISYAAGTLNVTPVSLTVLAVNVNKTYGAALPTLTASYTGFVNGDTVLSLTTPPTLVTTATSTSHLGSYPITASGAVDTDYTINYTAGTLTVTTASLVITTQNQTKAYGAALPTFTATYSGFVNGETSANLTTQPTLSTVATTHSHVSGNPYSINASGASESDYTITYVNGGLTVTPVALTITANDRSKVYGAALPSLTASYAGFINGDSATSLTTAPTLSTTATASSHITGSPYSITASGAVDLDYTISYASGLLTINPSGLLITADNQNNIYGAALPTLTASYAGLVNGDTSSSFTTLPTLSTSATASSHVAGNPYSITVGGAADADYAITYAAGSLTVTPAALLITADDCSKVYGAALPTLTATYSGLVNGDTSANLTTLPTITTIATATSHVPSTPYSITVAGAADTDYTITYAAGILSITPASLTITPLNQVKVYGAVLPILTVSYAGFVNGDSSSNLAALPVISTTGGINSHVVGSPYSITAGGAVDRDYSIAYGSGSLTVTPATLSISADTKYKLYGTSLPTLTASYTGFMSGDTVANLTTPPTLSTTATIESPVSETPYPITVSGAVDADYNLQYVTGSLYVINQPETNVGLSVSPSSSSTYGQTISFTATVVATGEGNPTPTGTIQFEIDGSFFGSAVTLINGSATSASLSSLHFGNHSIWAYYSGDENYGTNSQGRLQSITPAPLIITSVSQTKAYGAALPGLTATYAGLVNGDTSNSLTNQPTLATTATAQSHIGSFAITASGAFDPDYNISYVASTMSVTPVSLSITADDLTNAYGAALPTLTATYTGLVNGDTPAGLTTLPTLSTTATAASHVAGSPYTITASGATDTDYTISYATGTLTVNPVALAISADIQTKVYGAALPTLTATYLGFVGTDTSASLTTQPTLSTTATASSHVASSPYSITATGAVDADYTISYTGNTLTITQASLMITADNQTKAYAAALPTLTASYTGLVNGDVSTSLATSPTLTTTATAASHVAGNPYGISVGGAADSDYAISYSDGTLTVTPVALVVTAVNKSKVYGEVLPVLTAGYAGLVNGDTAASLTLQPTLSTSAVDSSHVSGSPYTITASSAIDVDYSITYASGSLIVTPALLTITPVNKTKNYGAALPTLTANYVGLVNGDTAVNLTTPPTLTSTATSSSHVSGNPYVITAGGAVDTDYSISYVAGSLTINPVSLTITAVNQNEVYGTAPPTLTASYNGFITGDTSASLTTQPTLATTATATSHVSGNPYSITASAAVDTDYTISYVGGVLTVTPAPLTITPDAQSKVYGAAIPTLTAGYSGFMNGDTSAILTTQPTLTTTATTHSHVSGNPYSITASGAVGSDYSITYVAGVLTVTPAALTITAVNKSKNYGAALPTLTATYSGFVNSDTTTSLTTQAALTTTATAASHIAGNPYSITPSAAVDPDYTISYVAGTLTVNPVALTITAVNKTKVYGAALPTLTATYSAFANGDTSSNLTTQPTLSTTATAASQVGSFTITAGAAVDSDYTISYVAGTLTVTTATLTITAVAQTKIYGAALPTLTASYTGFVNSDTSTNLTNQPTLTTTATAASHVTGSPYTITASAAVDSDYTISYVPGALTVTTAPLTITAVSLSKLYGAALPTLTASYLGFVNSDTSATLTTKPTLTTTATSASHVASSPYPITASGAIDSDYSISYVAGTLTVNPVALTITAVNKSKAYGAALPTLTATYVGFITGESSTNFTTQPTLATTGTSASHAGSYAITASGAVDSDYTISYVAGSLTVSTVPLTVTADSQTKIYGAALPTLTASYTGFVNGDTSTSLTTQPTLTTTATASSQVGSYTITAGAAVDTDYTISYVAGSLTVTIAPLTITAVAQTKVYGAALPTLTASYVGFVNGDTSTNLTTQPTLTTTASVSSQVGGYTITASAAVDTDYTISYVAGSLTVTTAPLTITAVSQTKVYGAALPTLTASYTGFVNDDTSTNLTTQPTLTTTATESSQVGSYTITASAAVDTDYTISYVAGSLTVTTAPLTITAVSQSKVYGAALPTLTASYTGFVNGDLFTNLTTQPTLTTTATASSQVGSYAITASAAVDADYTISYVSASLTVTTAGLTITADDQSKVYGAALPTLTASFEGFVNGDTATNLTTQPTLTTTASASSQVGSYAITASSAIDLDYTINYVAGTMTVTTAALTITANDQTKVYGAALPTLTASYTGFVNDDTSTSLTTQPTLTTTASASSQLGSYTINASAAVDADYTISYVAGSLTVTTATLTITAVDQTKVYGSTLPTLTATFVGFVNGDTSTNLTTQPTLTTSATAVSHVGSYSIIASAAVDANYTISYVDGTMTVTTDTLTITSDDQNKVYGAALPMLTASYAGFVNGDTSANLTTQPTLTTTASASSQVGIYAITTSAAVDPDYTISYFAGSLTVNPASLTVSADNQTKIYGASLPALTATYVGFVNGDTSLNLTTQPTLTTTATSAGHVAGNPYSINVSAALDPDYYISYSAGSLTVTPASLTITADDQSKVYGDALPMLTASYTGFVNGDTSTDLTTQPTLTTTAGATSHVVGSPYSITASEADDPDYTISYVDGSLTVTPALLTITADDQSKVYGDALPTLTASYTGFVNDDTSTDLTTQPTLTTTAMPFSSASGSPYPITASGAVDPDYLISYVSGSLTVTPAPATHFVLNGPVGGQAGTAELFTVTAEDQYNQVVTSYSGTVHFSSNDPMALLPADVLLINGEGSYSATFETAGLDSVVATATASPFITGADSGIEVTPAPATVFVLRGLSGGVAGTVGTVEVTAEDAYGNVATDFSNTIDLGTTDGHAVIPATTILTNGIGSFIVTLETAGSQSVTADYSVGTPITGSETDIVITPAAATSLTVSGLTGGVAGTVEMATVTALDAFGNVATGYSGTVHFTSSDAQAVLPVNSSLIDGSNTFEVTLDTSGIQSITATDTVTQSINGSDAGLIVVPASAASLIISTDSTSGLEATVTVMVLDSFGNIATGYAGTVHFTSTDAHATLPADAPLDEGVGIFEVTFDKSGTQPITVVDTHSNNLTATQLITVSQPATQAGSIVSSAPQTFFGQEAVFTATFSALRSATHR